MLLNVASRSFLLAVILNQASLVICQQAASDRNCTDVVIPTAVQRSSDLTSLTDEFDIHGFYALAQKKNLTTSAYNVSARICHPTLPRNSSRWSDTIQLLVHGATYNKIMWDFPYQPETYSYTQRMNAAGYSTIAVDLLGNGNSTVPDGLREAQLQVFVETVHQVAQQLKAGQIGGIRWRRVAVVGFSTGGVVANSLAEQYPLDADATLLHGISWESSWVFPAFLYGLQSPAAQVDPERWGHIPREYWTHPNIEARETACFHGSYDPGIVEMDYNLRDFDSLGASVTVLLHLVHAPEYRGPVFLGIGRNDNTFCGGPRCVAAPYELYNRFPVAANHTVEIYEDTGHAVIMHHSAPQLIGGSLQFLRNNGL